MGETGGNKDRGIYSNAGDDKGYGSSGAASTIHSVGGGKKLPKTTTYGKTIEPKAKGGEPKVKKKRGRKPKKEKEKGNYYVRRIGAGSTECCAKLTVFVPDGINNSVGL